MEFLNTVFTVLNYDITFIGISFNLMDVLAFELITSIVGLFVGKIIFFNND